MKPKTKLEIAVLKYASLILEGRILAVDPSSGSSKSLPGYAIYEKGKLIDSGVISVDTGKVLNVKLRMIADSLRNEFPVPDVLVIENLPPFMGNAGDGPGFGFNKSILNLHRSVGAIMSAVPCEPIVEVAPVSWRKNVPDNYVKSDENDAILMGYTVVRLACILMGRDVPTLQDLKGKITIGIESTAGGMK